MKFKASRIDSLVPFFDGNTGLKCDIHFSERQKIELFYVLWEWIGDDGIKELIENEGYKIEKIV